MVSIDGWAYRQDNKALAGSSNKQKAPINKLEMKDYDYIGADYIASDNKSGADSQPGDYILNGLNWGRGRLLETKTPNSDDTNDSADIENQKKTRTGFYTTNLSIILPGSVSGENDVTVVNPYNGSTMLTLDGKAAEGTMKSWSIGGEGVYGSFNKFGDSLWYAGGGLALTDTYIDSKNSELKGQEDVLSLNLYGIAGYKGKFGDESRLGLDVKFRQSFEYNGTDYYEPNTMLSVRGSYDFTKKFQAGVSTTIGSTWYTTPYGAVAIDGMWTTESGKVHKVYAGAGYATSSGTAVIQIGGEHDLLTGLVKKGDKLQGIWKANSIYLSNTGYDGWAVDVGLKYFFSQED